MGQYTFDGGLELQFAKPANPVSDDAGRFVKAAMMNRRSSAETLSCLRTDGGVLRLVTFARWVQEDLNL